MKETFPIVVPGAAPLVTIAAVCAVVVAVLVLMLAIAVSLRSGSVTVSAEGLRLRVPLYGRLIPASTLELATARPLDLSVDSEYVPKWRTNGIGLPGYAVGWFKLRNGQKALAAVTNMHRVALIPTTKGYSVLVSSEDPQALIDSLRRLAAKPAS